MARRNSAAAKQAAEKTEADVQPEEVVETEQVESTDSPEDAVVTPDEPAAAPAAEHEPATIDDAKRIDRFVARQELVIQGKRIEAGTKVAVIGREIDLPLVRVIGLIQTGGLVTEPEFREEQAKIEALHGS